MEILSNRIKSMSDADLQWCLKEMNGEDLLHSYNMMDRQAQARVRSCLSEHALKLFSEDLRDFTQDYMQLWEVPLAS